MATLTVTAGTDYSADTLVDIDFIEFTSGADATFAASQFDNLAILDTVLIEGAGLLCNIIVNGGSIDASQWRFGFWPDIYTVTLNGTSQDDTITGSDRTDILTGRNGADTLTGGDGDDIIKGGSGRDIIEGGTGTDRLIGGTQNDEFDYFHESEFDVVIGDTINGGGGTEDKIAVDGFNSLVDFTDAVITNVEILEFRSSNGAVFDGDDFGPGGISTVIGPLGEHTTYLVVEGSAVDLSAVEFVGWEVTEEPSSFEDDITIRGTIAADTLTGSVHDDFIDASWGDDIIDGGDGDDFIVPDEGRDTVDGGAGNDLIRYDAGDELVAGESIDGGAGDDDVLLLNLHAAVPYQIFDLGSVFVSGIEELELFGGLNGDNSRLVRLPGDLFGSNSIERVTITTACLLEFTGFAVDLSGITFDGTAVAEASTLLSGTGGSNILIGGTLGDTIRGSTAVDGLLGNGGDDIFLLNTGAEIVAGDIIDGGADTDTVELSAALSGTVDFTVANIDSIERLVMLGANQEAILGDEQISALTEAEGSSGKQTLEVTAGAIDLSALSFTRWVGSDIVKLTGTSGADSITGSAEKDIIVGLDGDDVMNGGAGDDQITGGLGRDELTGGAGSDSFAYQSLDDTPTGASRDRIEDFTQGEDIIIIEMTGFTFIEDDAFSAIGGAEINYEQTGGATILNLDGDGDGVAEAKIALTGTLTITNADLILL